VSLTPSAFLCWHHHEYSIKVLEGLIENDAWFANVLLVERRATESLI